MGLHPRVDAIGGAFPVLELYVVYGVSCYTCLLLKKIHGSCAMEDLRFDSLSPDYGNTLYTFDLHFGANILTPLRTRGT